MTAFDPEIIQDFLTESGELLDELETDLVELERSPKDLDLLNKVFRALHTIKGSASFLAMSELVSIAHAAETALNAARNGAVIIDRPAMDMLLDAVDVLKTQFDQLRANEPMSEPDPALVERLVALGEGRQPAQASQAPAGTSDTAETPAQASESPVAAPASDEDQTAAPDHAAQIAPEPRPAPVLAGATTRPLELPESKADLVEFLINDLDESLETISGLIVSLGEPENRAAASAQLAEAADALRRSVDFFEFQTMTSLAHAIEVAASGAGRISDPALGAMTPRLGAVVALLGEQVRGLRRAEVLDWPVATLTGRIEALVEDETIPETSSFEGESIGEAQHLAVLVADGVIPQDAAPIGRAEDPGLDPIEPDSGTEPVVAGTISPEQSGAEPAVSEATEPGRTPATKAPEQTIRVEVGRLESLMNLVGELVLQKNRVSGLSRRFASEHAGPDDQELREQISTASCDLDRVTADIQMAVMRTRMQPLDKIFGRYPRLIRDLAAKTSKQIDLRILGGDTEVDKSVLEELGDPLVHLMRNSADHGIEPPAARLEKGKPERGTITLHASNEGSHVRVCVIDDGKGLDPKVIGAKAVARGLTTEAELATLSDQEIQRFVFEPGFSTADAVSDLSGRGVGMDVVRSNVQKIKGTVDVESTPGQGTRFVITIPLTVAIMPAMMVRIAHEVYAVPLDNIIEIVKPDPSLISTIGDRPVVRMRGSVLPVIDGCEAFEMPPGVAEQTPFMVVLSLNDKRIGLMVTELIGQQEIVIKPLDGIEHRGPVSGATVRDDGTVSLIVDVSSLIRRAEGRPETRPLVAAA